jgi:integrase/recombinase XerD
LRDRAILETFFSTGMRISELTALNREQVKFKNADDEFELSISGKGEKRRTVYFSSRTLYWLKKYLDTRSDDSKPLFINHRKVRDSRLTISAIEKNIKKYAIDAGLPINTTPHVMRHSFATDLLSQGVDLRILQEFLGHRSIMATQIYAHVTSKQLKDIHKKYHGKK